MKGKKIEAVNLQLQQLHVFIKICFYFFERKSIFFVIKNKNQGTKKFVLNFMIKSLNDD